jgi:Zn-dependent protease
MSACPRCGAELAPQALACATCHRLVHAELLSELATQAQAEEARVDLSAALGTWRQMSALLPPGTRQAEQVQAKIVELSERLDLGEIPPPPQGSRFGGGGARTGLGALLLSGAALAWKGKFLLLLGLTKAKTLLVGLTKLPTLLSMFLTVGVYTTVFGWKFALGFVLSIYVHEIGHVVALRRYGIPATAPMFIPGLGAFVRLKQYPATPREDATVGLAGPLWGLGAAVACALWWVATGSELAAALAQVGAWINLFNLLPIWQLDGGRGWHALDRNQRWLAVAALGVGWFVSGDTLVFILGLVALVRAAAETAPERGDNRALLTYAGLVLALSGMLAWLPDPAPLH